MVHEFYQYMTNALIITVVNDSMEEKKVIETIRENSKMCMEKSLCQN